MIILIENFKNKKYHLGFIFTIKHGSVDRPSGFVVRGISSVTLIASWSNASHTTVYHWDEFGLTTKLLLFLIFS
jgi:hypothetical protein